MVSVVSQAHRLVQAVLLPGEIAIDATAGNGHDTLFLARQVGPQGRVFALDIQAAALAQTQHRLSAAGIENVALILGDHALMRELIPAEVHGRVGAVMFNLGYLPGGDKRVTTQVAHTFPALENAVQVLRPGGILSVVAYPGHPGGAEETEQVERWFEEMGASRLEQLDVPREAGPGPRLLVGRRTAPAAGTGQL